MNSGTLTLVPSGGLANRMRAVASAYSLCEATGSRLQVVWFRDWALNAAFNDIFEPVDPSLFDLREARILDFIVNDVRDERIYGYLSCCKCSFTPPTINHGYMNVR